MSFNSCIKNLLKFICVLQNNSVNINNNIGCSKIFLAPNYGHNCFNTRIITLYGKSGEILSTTFDKNGIATISSNFRVHSVINDCCTLLILDDANGKFISTGQYITMKINCICAIKCTQDVIVSNL